MSEHVTNSGEARIPLYHSGDTEEFVIQDVGDGVVRLRLPNGVCVRGYVMLTADELIEAVQAVTKEPV